MSSDSSSFELKFSLQSSAIQQSNQQPSKSTLNNKSNSSSKYLPQYRQYFSDVEAQVEAKLEQRLSDESSMLQHRLIVINPSAWNSKLISFTRPFILLSSQQYEGLIVNYEIVIAMYKIQVTLLNAYQDAPQNLKILGRGSYGHIVRIMVPEYGNIVAKRVKFVDENTLLDRKLHSTNWVVIPNKKDIQYFLSQFAIYKICSFFQIGPSIKNISGFDLVCFNDCIEFYMQQCQTIDRTRLLPEIDLKKLQNSTKVNLRLLHHLKIIHKDIKPDNLLFSPKYEAYVLSDFGISHSVLQQLGNLSATYKQGTFNYMSQQMKLVDKDTKIYIDLYYNDMYGLKATLTSLRKIVPAKKSWPLQHLTQETDEFYVFLPLFRSFIEQDLTQLIYTARQYCKYNSQTTFINRCKSLGNKKLSRISSKMHQGFGKLGHNVYLQIYQHFINMCIQANANPHIQIQFLVRVYGVNQTVQNYMKNLTEKSEKINKLLDRLKNKNSKLIPVKELQDLHRLEILYQQQRIENLLERQFKFFKSKPIRELTPQDISDYKDCLINLMNRKLQQGNIKDCRILLDKLNTFHNPTQIEIILLDIYYYMLNFSSSELQTILQLIRKLAKDIQTKFIKILINMILQFPKDIQLLLRICGKEYLVYVGDAYYQHNLFQKALLHYEQALKVCNKPNSKHIDSGFFYNNIGMCYYRISQFEYALRQFKLAFKIIGAVKGDSHHYIATIYNNLGICYYALGKYQIALTYYQKSKKIKFLTLGQNHPNMATTYGNIGLCQLSMMEFQKAEQYQEKALNITLNTFGEVSMQTASYLINVSNCYNNMTKYDKAIQYSNRVLVILDKLDRLVSPLASEAFKSLGLSYARTKRIEEALKYLEKSIKLKRQIYGIQHIEYAHTLNLIGNCFSEIQREDSAIQHRTEALAIYSRILKQPHQDIATTQFNLAKGYAKTHQIKQSIRFLYLAIRNTINTHKINKYTRQLIQIAYNRRHYLLALYYCNKLNKSDNQEMMYGMGYLYTGLISVCCTKKYIVKSCKHLIKHTPLILQTRNHAQISILYFYSRSYEEYLIVNPNKQAMSPNCIANKQRRIEYIQSLRILQGKCCSSHQLIRIKIQKRLKFKRLLIKIS